MDNFPLAPFLASLTGDGIRPTIADYERISVALRAGEGWTLARLRDVLLALLAKDDDQQEVLLRRFDDFFKLDPGAADAFDGVDVERALADLAQLSQARAGVRRPELAPDGPRRLVRETGTEPRFKFRWWMALPAVLLIVALVAIGYILQQPTPTPTPTPTPAPPFTVNPTVLNFGNQLTGNVGAREVTLANDGPAPLSFSAAITGPHAADFMVADYVVQPIPTGGSLTITVSFGPSPDSTGRRTAFLDVSADGADSPQRVALSGVGIVAEVELTPTPSGQKRLYTNVPYVSDIEYLPLETSTEWLRYAVLAVLFLCAALLYWVYIQRARQIPQDEPAKWDPAGPRHFPLGSIGGQPAPHLDDETLGQLADSMGYFQSGQSGRVLDVPVSIEATLRGGGIPALEFHRRKQVRSLMILEDSFAEASGWNPIAGELAAGMRRRGVPVLHGQFGGSPDRFKTEDGSVYHLEDLEDQRRGYLLLIFTDGKGLYRPESGFALESLARWPMAAWMELREPRSWDETSALPIRYGIPIYPATPDGALRAVRRFLTEQGAEPDFAWQAVHWQGLPEQRGDNLTVYVEELLGDALAWAQDCAMFQSFQPISPGLADKLRLEFHPRLPPGRIERLHALPGTLRTVSGLRFSDDVLKVLRGGFFIRSESEQRAVLQFLLARVAEAEPDEPGSLAYLAWETVRERLRMELDPDAALARLAQLAQTDLGSAIDTSLDSFGLPDQEDKIPLRVKPRSKHGLQRLARMAEGFRIPRLEAYPVPWVRWVNLGLMVVLFLAFTGWGLQNYMDESQHQNQGFLLLPGFDGYVQLDVLEGETWQEITSRSMLSSASLSGMSLPPGASLNLAFPLLREEGNYRLTLYEGGYRTTREFTGTIDSSPRISVDVRAIELDCDEEFLEIGLAVMHCPYSETATTEVIQLPTRQEWLEYDEPGNRLTSIGLEISTSGQNDALLQSWHNTLLETSSIDVLYRIQPGSNGEWHIDEAFAQLREDLGPRIEQSQLIWWEVGQTPDITAVEGALSEFDSTLKLSDGEDLSWIAALEPLFEPGENVMVTEEEILAALGREQAIVSNRSVLLIRPLRISGELFTPTPTACAPNPPPNWQLNTVQPGDNLTSLARSRSTTVDLIQTVNCFASDIIIFSGQQLYLPALPTPTFTPTPIDTPIPTSTRFPIITPQLLSPSQGGETGSTANFTWSGFQYVGQTYQVTAYHLESGETRRSESLITQSWTANLPGEKYGEWRWTVTVIQSGQVVATSSEGMFWFVPFPITPAP